MPSRGQRKAAAQLTAIVLLTWWVVPARVHAQVPVIPPGQEALAGEILGAGVDLPGGCRFGGASLEREHVEARYRCGDRDAVLRLIHPSRADADTSAAGPFALVVGEPAPPDSLVRAIATRARERGTRWRWIERARPEDGMTNVRLRAWPTPTSVLLVIALMAAALSSVRRLRRTRRSRGVAVLRRHLPALAILAVFVGIALLVPQHGPVHEHATFLYRSDCARQLGCDEARVGWAPPAYHAYGLFFRALPYRLTTLWSVSLALTTLALGLFYAFVHALASRSLGPRTARRVALVALGLTAFHPLMPRLAVATSFWPGAACALFGAGLATVLAVRSRGADRALLTVVGAGLFSLAVTSSLTLFVLAPLAVLFPWTLSPKRPRAFTAIAILVPLSFAAHHMAIIIGRTPETVGAAIGLASSLRTTATNLVYGDPALTPVALLPFFVLGLAWMARRPRAWGVVLYAFVATELLLSPLNKGLAGYPVRYLHGYTSLFWSGLAAALGLEATRRFVRHHRPGAARMVLPAGLVLAALTLAWTSESRSFLLEPRPLASEARAISEALERLPEHDVVVVPPEILSEIDGLGWSGDPIEVHYPAEEHRATMRRRFGRAPQILRLDQVLARGAPPRGRVLVYVGSSLKTWQPNEIAAGVVPDDLARPELVRLRQRWSLEPVHTFEIGTADHPAVISRLGAWRVPSLELGYHRLTE